MKMDIGRHRWNLSKAMLEVGYQIVIDPEDGGWTAHVGPFEDGRSISARAETAHEALFALYDIVWGEPVPEVTGKS